MSMISQTAEYALRAMVHLADQGEACTTAQIAKATQIPSGYLAKVLRNLARASLVQSQRGLHGGFALERAAAEISLLDVVNAVDPVKRILTCPLNLPCHGPQLCPLHQRLDDAICQVEDSFRSTNLAELLEVPQHRKPLCQLPAPGEQ